MPAAALGPPPAIAPCRCMAAAISARAGPLLTGRPPSDSISFASAGDAPSSNTTTPFGCRARRCLTTSKSSDSAVAARPCSS